jgi:hypothetical protein
MRITSPLGFVATVLAASWSFAQSGVDLMVRPFPKDNVLEMRGEASGYTDAHIKKSNEDFSLGIYDLEGRYRLNPGEHVDPRIGFDVTYLNMGGNFNRVPDSLVDTGISFGMGVLDQSGWLGGASFGIGYAGAAPFGDGNAWYGKFDLAFGKKISETQEFGFVIDYDGNRSVYRDIPLPGFVYRLRLTEKHLLIAAGFPYTSVEYKPDDHWTFEVRWLIPDDFDASINYKIDNGLGIFGGVRRRVESFFWDELSDSHDRLFFQQRRAEVGFSWEPIERLRGELAFGYAWDQEFSTGWSNNNTDLVGDVSDEPYVRIGVQWQY